MGIAKLWERTSEGEKYAIVSLVAGVAAIIFATIFGVEEGIAFALGLTVTVGFGAVALWVWAKSKKNERGVVGVDPGTVIIIVSGVALLIGVLFSVPWLMRYPGWGICVGVLITFF